jgi:hypothetical protein
VYSMFMIEKKHWFNKQTPGLFFTDKLKSLALTFFIGGPFMALLLQIIKMGGSYFYVFVWRFMFIFSMFMMIIVPVFIMPLLTSTSPYRREIWKHKFMHLPIASSIHSQSCLSWMGPNDHPTQMHSCLALAKTSELVRMSCLLSILYLLNAYTRTLPLLW